MVSQRGSDGQDGASKRKPYIFYYILLGKIKVRCLHVFWRDQVSERQTSKLTHYRRGNW